MLAGRAPLQLLHGGVTPRESLPEAVRGEVRFAATLSRFRKTIALMA